MQTIIHISLNLIIIGVGSLLFLFFTKIRTKEKLKKKLSEGKLRGLHRLVILVSAIIGLYGLYEGIQRAFSEYKLFSGFEKVELFKDIPVNVLGEGYSLGLLLTQHLLLAIAEGLVVFIIFYLSIPTFIAGTRQTYRWAHRIALWIYNGFNEDASSKKMKKDRKFLLQVILGGSNVKAYYGIL